MLSADLPKFSSVSRREQAATAHAHSIKHPDRASTVPFVVHIGIFPQALTSLRWRHEPPARFLSIIHGIAAEALEDAFAEVTHIQQREIPHHLSSYSSFLADVNFTYLGHDDFPFNHTGKASADDSRPSTGAMGLYGMLERAPGLFRDPRMKKHLAVATTGDFLAALERCVGFAVQRGSFAERNSQILHSQSTEKTRGVRAPTTRCHVPPVANSSMSMSCREFGRQSVALVDELSIRLDIKQPQL